jgi:hypothetical protein
VRRAKGEPKPKADKFLEAARPLCRDLLGATLERVEGARGRFRLAPPPVDSDGNLPREFREAPPYAFRNNPHVTERLYLLDVLADAAHNRYGEAQNELNRAAHVRVDVAKLRAL